MASDPEHAGDTAEDIDDVEDIEEPDPNDDPNLISTALLRQSDLMATIQARIREEMLLTMPAPVKRRLKALKKIQLEATHIEAKFYAEVHALECKYQTLHHPLYMKRGEIISGLYEPNDEECAGMSDDEKEDVKAEVKDELSFGLATKVKIEDVAEQEQNQKDKEAAENLKNSSVGIPDFWLTIFKNVALLSEMVEEHDEAILKHLIDIKVFLFEKDPMGFALEFHFSPNEYFSNSVLTKEYEMKCKPDESDPFSFEGPEIFKCKGCIIDWYKGKNVTVKTVKKKQKHKSRGSVRTVTRTVQNDSFFNFFSPPCVPEDPEAELDEDTQTILTSDFEIGHYIRERIVPRAVLYFTGEALEGEDDYDDDSEEDDEEEEDDDEEVYNPPPKAKGPPPHAGVTSAPGECKQQ